MRTEEAVLSRRVALMYVLAMLGIGDPSVVQVMLGGAETPEAAQWS